MKHEIVHIGESAYEVVRKIRESWFEKALSHYGASVVTKNLGYDKILRSRDGTHLLVYEIKEADVIEDV